MANLYLSSLSLSDGVFKMSEYVYAVDIYRHNLKRFPKVNQMGLWHRNINIEKFVTSSQKEAYVTLRCHLFLLNFVFDLKIFSIHFLHTIFYEKNLKQFFVWSLLFFYDLMLNTVYLKISTNLEILYALVAYF